MPSASTSAPSLKSVPAKSSSSFDLGAGPAASGRGSVAGDCARGSPVCSAPSGSYARLEAHDGELRVEVVRARDGTVDDSFAVPPRR